MPYTPPPPGSTEVGKPTPEGLPKQDAHIRDLPPEVRRSFLLSMVFFPAAVGAGICAVLFLGWWVLRNPKTPAQYALELRQGVQAGDKRSRWQAARELAENIQDPRLHDPQILSALLDIVKDPALDEEVDTWSPSDMIRSSEEKRTRLRYWAAYYAGHLGGVLGDPDGQTYQVLSKAMEEENPADPGASAGLRYYIAAGLGMLKDRRSIPQLAKHATTDPDPVVRAGCVKSLGAIGWQYHFAPGAPRGPAEELEAVRTALLQAYHKDLDPDVTWNAAVALARIHDSTGKATLEKLAQNNDPVVQQTAKKALTVLDEKK